MNARHFFRLGMSFAERLATSRKPRCTDLALIVYVALWTSSATGQVTMPLPGRVLVKLLPDYSRALVYALNGGNGSLPGTLLALNSTNGAVISEISLDLMPH